MTFDDVECAYPPCRRQAVGTLKRPGTGQEIPLCLEHKERGERLIAWLREQGTEGT